MAFTIKSRMLSYGYTDPFEFLVAMQQFTIETVVQNIRCPVLVCAAEHEPFAPGQAEQLFQALRAPKAFSFFKTSEGAGEHREMGASSLFYQTAFDWLDTVIKL